MQTKSQKIKQEIQLLSGNAQREKAYAFALGDELSGEALIKQAFSYLHDMPADRVNLRGANLSKTGFIQGYYIQLSLGARPLIQTLPVTTDLSFPVITSIENIAVAFEALKKTLQQNADTLHDYAVNLSTQELLNAYQKIKPLTLENIPSLLASLSYCSSKTGYTGLPFSYANTLCAQLAWLVVDKTKRNPQEQFWKLLYPQVTGTYGVMADSHWPAYAEAILDNELINYRLFYQDVNHREKAQRFPDAMPESVRDRIKTFHSGHYGFWFCDDSPDLEPNQKKFKNYLELFLSLKDFTIRNSSQRTGEQFESKIQLQSDDEFLRDYYLPLERFLRWHENKDYILKKTDEAILCPKGKTGLIEIIRNLSHKGSRFRCLDANSENFKKLFDRNEGLENFLRGISISLLVNHENMEGLDNLDYHPSHCLFINDLDREGLLHLLKHGKNLPMNEIAARYDELSPPKINGASIPTGAALLNFCAYINDLKIEQSFVEALLKIPYFDDSILQDHRGHASALRVYERNSCYDAYAKTLVTIQLLHTNGGYQLDGFELRKYFYGLVYVIHKDMESFKYLESFAQGMNIKNPKVEIYINSAPNDQNYIKSLMDYFRKAWPEDNTYFMGCISGFFAALSLDKKKLVFNCFKNEILEFITHVDSRERYISLTDCFSDIENELFDLCKETLKTQVKTPQDISKVIKVFSHDLIIDFIPFICENEPDNYIFKDEDTLYKTINRLEEEIWSPEDRNVFIYLKPFLLRYITDAKIFTHAVDHYFNSRQSTSLLTSLFLDKIPGWVIDSDTLFKIYLTLESSHFQEVVRTLLTHKRLHSVLGSGNNIFYVLQHLSYQPQDEDLWKPLCAALDSQIITKVCLKEALTVLSSQTNYQYFLNLLDEKIKKHIDIQTFKDLFCLLPLEVFRALSKHINPNILEGIKEAPVATYQPLRFSLPLTGPAQDEIDIVNEQVRMALQL